MRTLSSLWLLGLGCSGKVEIAPSDSVDTGSLETDTAQNTDTGDSDTTLEDAGYQEFILSDHTVSVEWSTNNELRSYTLRSTRVPTVVKTLSEQPDDPKLRSGNPLTDALFALANHEARENSTSEISDGAFTETVACDCYQTGAEWNWVWTRDIGYAVDLGLKHLDAERSWNSLWFKTAERKAGGFREIVQDTGTAGSWPVSSDRVVWTRGAMSVWRQLTDVTRKEELRTKLIEVLQNTVLTDRQYVLDPLDGLYRGETSFLDWREQTYPQWMIDTPAHIAMSKSLSTNLNHLYTLRALEELTGSDWSSDELATAIDAHFWTGTQYSSFIATDLFPQAVHQQDLLATSLAVLELGTHPEALTQYPHTPHGAPVIHPQQQFTPIYHNRAQWPFVTTYALLAARQSNQGQIFDTHLNVLIEGAALSLSNMENMEFQSGEPWVDDGVYSGPVINSERQLWSVAGFIGAVVEGVFGLAFDPTTQQWGSNPILPNQWFETGATLEIHGQQFSIGTARLNAGEIHWLDESDWQQVFAPQTPTLTLNIDNGTVYLDPTPLEADVGFQFYKDGAPFNPSTNVPTDTPTESTCYSVTTTFEGSPNISHPANPVCWWGPNYDRIQSLFLAELEVEGGAYSTNHGRPHYENWGLSDHTIRGSFTVQHTGTHLLQVVYGNGSGSLDSGITCAVKLVRFYDEDGTLLDEQPLVLPQLGSWDVWADSTFATVHATADQTLHFEIVDGLNMSHFSHYRTYAGNGGGDAPYNFVNISEVKLLYRGPTQ